MKIKRPSKTVITAILVAVLSILWLKELTLRRAIISANDYMYPFLTSGKYYPMEYDFRWFDTISDIGECPFSPGWYILFEPDTLSNPIHVRISILGKPTGTTDYRITDSLSLPDGVEKKQAIEKIIND